MKHVVLPLILMACVISLQAADPKSEADRLLKQGISLYNQKKNPEARDALLGAVARYKKLSPAPEELNQAWYILGNVYMNLKEYKKAIGDFYSAIYNGYRPADLLFNMACAQSLDGSPGDAMNFLLVNYAGGDRKAARVKNDPDLAAFRSSVYYKKYTEILGKLNPGIVPKDGQTVIKYMKEVGTFYNLGEPSPGSFHFYEDGRLEYYDCCGFGGVLNAGTWKIDERRKTLVITLLGSVAVKSQAETDLCKRGGQPFDEKKHFYRGESGNPEYDYFWCERLARPVVDVIPFESIRLNVVDLKQIAMSVDYSFVRYNRFGDPKKNRVIKNVIGDFIDKSKIDEIK